MKKTLLPMIIIVCWLYSIQTYAATGLNPYAYKLEYGNQSDNNRKMTLRYWLNAPAESAQITLSYILDDTPQVLSLAGTTNEGENEVTISTAGLPAGVPISWSVTATRTSKESPTQISQYYHFYCPHGLAIDTDPYSDYFGRILVTETLHDKAGTSNRNYVSKVNGTSGKIQAGLYAFDAQFNLIGEKGAPIGDKTFTQQLAPFGSFDGGHQPMHVKISEDGRIFVSCGDMRPQGAVVWELSKDLTTWTPIIREQSGWTDDYELKKGGNFYAGFNCSLDVSGSGENLKLLLYSAKKNGVLNHHLDCYRLDEYEIGTHTGSDFAGKINNIWAYGEKRYGVVYDNVRVIYDGLGGYWLGANRGLGDKDEPNLVHVNANNVQDQYVYTTDFYGGPGIMLHTATHPTYAGQTWLFKGKERTSSANGKFGVWKITTQDDGTTLRKLIWTIQSTGLGRNHNAFAVDFAENLYIVGNSGERIIAFALPYEGTKTTPAKSTFTLDAVDNNATYDVVIDMDPADAGTVKGAGKYHYQESVTVEATPSNSDRYEFVEWRNENGTKISSNNPYTFSILQNTTITAHFRLKQYKVEYFNLFKKRDGAFQDITDYHRGEAATMDKEKNSRLWRLFQVQYNETYDVNRTDYGTATQGGRILEKVLAFVNSGGTATLRNRANDFCDNDQAPKAFYWLGQYIEHVVNCGDIAPINNVNVWGFYLQSFFNRTYTSWNQDFSDNTEEGKALTGSYIIRSFAEAGKPDYWRKWWQQIELDLDTTWNYDKAMPTTWSMRTPPTGSIEANGSTYTPSDWYQWNNEAANEGKILGWYYGDKNPDTWTDDPTQVQIVHNVNKSGNLIAIWLEKKISESKHNYDILKLMNTQHNAEGGNTHDIIVDRPLQADMYNTICLPFTLSTLTGTPYDGATVLRFVGAEFENGEPTGDGLTDEHLLLNFEEVTFQGEDIMIAGKPYLIKPQVDISSEVIFTGIPKDGLYLKDGETEVDNNGYVRMHGRVNPTIIKQDPNTLLLVANNRLATPSEANGEMRGLRAYFTLTGAAAAYQAGGQSILQITKKVPTQVETPQAIESVTSQPKSKKIMYQGQIYILRGGKVYDLQGRQVNNYNE